MYSRWGMAVPLKKVVAAATAINVICNFSKEKYKTENKYLKTLAKNSQKVTKAYFKWTDPYALKYKIKYATYFTCKGKRVGKKATRVRSG